ncbi:MAG: hypothetical protein H7A49_09080 [Akkermansiaceae bacterium]|nr:hypothetical protein [Akkermansiaceae bacterium]MCP5548089.1 hypothetical protein [Akkermansiaceae bacterium]
MIFRIHRPLLACCLSIAGVADGAEVTLGFDTPPVMDGVRNLAGAADAPSNVQLQYASSNFLSGETNGVLGQTFTTGPNPAGYSLTSISFQQVSHDTTWWLGGTLGLRVFQTTNTPVSGVQDISVLAAETGFVPEDGAGLQQAVPGANNVWVTITLDQTPPLHLEPDTRYGFDIQTLGTPGTGPFVMEWNGIHSDELAGGQAIINGTPGTPSVRSVWLGRGPVDGDRVFVASMTAVTPVTLSPDTPPVGDGVQNLTGSNSAAENTKVQYSNSNYLSGNNNGVLGQTFTTGPNPNGYHLTSLSFQQAPYSTQWWTGGTVGYRVFQTTDAPDSGVQHMTVLAADTGAVPEISASLEEGTPGNDALWVTIGMPQSPPIFLQPNTRYGFDLQATGTTTTGPFLIEWNGTESDVIGGGQALINGSPANPSPDALWLGRGPVDGDRVFVAAMTALGPPKLGVRAHPDSVSVDLDITAGKWYSLESSETLLPDSWSKVFPGPIYGFDPELVLEGLDYAPGGREFFRLKEDEPAFLTNTGADGVASLRPPTDAAGNNPLGTEFIAAGRELGNVALKYRPAGGTTWRAADTSTSDGVAFSWHKVRTSTDGTRHTYHHEMTTGLTGKLTFETEVLTAGDHVGWKLHLKNESDQTITIGDLAIPLPMNTAYSGSDSSVFKHSFISGNNSWAFWMRPDSVGPHLVMTTDPNTRLEYWDGPGARGQAYTYKAYIHAAAAAQVAVDLGSEWRQPTTNLTLEAGAEKTYGFKFQWADGYDAIRQLLVDEGKIDVHVVPGMTVPTDLAAKFSLRTTQTIHSVQAEFPAETVIQSLGPNGDHNIYQVQFSRLGENRLTIDYGDNQQTYLEFFVTEPLETLITKRAAFLEAKQIKNPSKWYDGLYPEWNMASQTLLTPENYDLLSPVYRYIITADDAGLARPAFLALKNSVMPVQAEVTSLDRYIDEFVWGGLQRTTSETYPYGIYGVRDWFSLRNSSDPGRWGQLHLWRTYDYPHITTMYKAMYRIAKYNPQITTTHTANEYLQRAYGTAMAMFTIPYSVWPDDLWIPYHIGYMNEAVIPRLIEDLETEGMTTEAAGLRAEWEQKVEHFLSSNGDLFVSEMPFDSTGFESNHAVARYAVENAATMNPADPAGFEQTARNFMDLVTNSNITVRGWLEPAYYHYGSDYRGNAGDTYTLSYMSQLGGWGILDYALHFSTDPSPYLRLGYGSILSSWALMNTGTTASNYGYWYPGAANDGAVGGGFEASPYNDNWLELPIRRGAWFYGCEEDLGFCGAIRAAATILADDPIFGRFCYGGESQVAGDAIHVTPKDGVRQRFHAILDAGRMHLQLENDRFSSGSPITIGNDLSTVDFELSTSNPSAHNARLKIAVSLPGTYVVSGASGVIATLVLSADQESMVDLPIAIGVGTAAFTINRQ